MGASLEEEVLPTFAELAGSDIPETLDEISMLHPNGREYLHGEHSGGDIGNQHIVTKTDKYCWFMESGREQYFDLNTIMRWHQIVTPGNGICGALIRGGADGLQFWSGPSEKASGRTPFVVIKLLAFGHDLLSFFSKLYNGPLESDYGHTALKRKLCRISCHVMLKIDIPLFVQR